jgi:hypothetical protein
MDMNTSNTSNIFKEYDIPIPNIIYSYDTIKQKEIYDYLSQLIKDEQQKKAYKIAFEHLGSSFNIYNSNGFKEWKKNLTQHQPQK